MLGGSAWPSNLRRLRELQGLGIDVDDVGHGLVIGGCRERWPTALALLVERPGLRSFTAAVGCLGASASGLVGWAEGQGLALDVVAYGTLVSACPWRQGLELLGRMARQGLELNAACATAVMQKLEPEAWPQALRLLERLERRDRCGRARFQLFSMGFAWMFIRFSSSFIECSSSFR